MFAKCLLSAGVFANHQCGHVISFNWIDLTLFFFWLLCLIIIFLTSSSLEVCATTAVSRKSILLSVCKMHVLQCMGKSHTIAEESTCRWPERNTGCTNCHMWETCDGRDIQSVAETTWIVNINKKTNTDLSNKFYLVQTVRLVGRHLPELSSYRSLIRKEIYNVEVAIMETLG